MSVTISPNLKKETARIDASGRIIHTTGTQTSPAPTQPTEKPIINEPSNTPTLEEKMAQLETKLDRILNTFK